MLGLADHCNISDQLASWPCPWCKIPIAGTLAVLTSIMSGVWVGYMGIVSTYPTPNRHHNSALDYPLTPKLFRLGDYIVAIIAFMTTALAAAVVTVIWAGYPEFPMGF